MPFPGTYNFDYYRGDRNSFTITPKNSDGTTFSLNGYTASYLVALNRGTSSNIAIATAAVTSTATTNVVTCTIFPSVGLTLAATSYVYDVSVTNSATTSTYTLLTGTIIVTDHIGG